MGNNRLISVIIPLYNAELYIEDCINSIEQQTFKDFEIILVNDGSKDNSLEICKNVSLKYNNIILIDKKNEGVVSARNEGIKNSKGKFIFFLDIDDKMPSYALELLLNNMISTGADMTLGPYIYEYKGCNVKLSNKPFRECDGFSFFRNFHENGTCSIWGKLIKRTLLDKIDLEKIPKNLKYAEDMLMLFYLSINASKVSFVDKPVYNYIYRENSAMSKRELCIKDTIKVFSIIDKVLFNSNSNYIYSFKYYSPIIRVIEDLLLIDNFTNDEIEAINYWKKVILKRKINFLKMKIPLIIKSSLLLSYFSTRFSRLSTKLYLKMRKQ